MKRHLLSQIRNEWRSNLWMIIELTIISAILWFLFSFLCAIVHIRFTHKGYDLSDIYVADIRAVSKESPLFHPYDSLHNYRTDLDMLWADMRANPYVELVGTGSNAMPYNYNFSGDMWGLIEVDSIYTYYGNRREVSPEVVRILRLEGTHGETPEQLASVLEKGDIIISPASDEYVSKYPDPEFFRGKDLVSNSDSSVVKRVGAIAAGLQRNDYESLFSGVIYYPIAANGLPQQMIFRIKPGMSRQFSESLSPDDKQVGNVYLSNLQHIDRMRDKAQVDINITIRNLSICVVFLLLVIFLSFLGTFWFRTQQRVSEIAIRKVNGATRRNIFVRFIGEGMILLCIATVLATAIEAALLYFSIISITEMFGSESWILYESMAVTFAVMTLLVIAGIWMPARKAMSINPAYALKDQ